MTNYSIFLHYKQGDDFSSCLKHENDNISAAFALWSLQHKANADRCERLTKMFSKLPADAVEINADTHVIDFIPKTKQGEEFLEMLVKENLINKEEFEDDEEDDDDDEVVYPDSE